jgi:putative DNA primase/helicase
MLADFDNVLARLNIAQRNEDKAMCFCPAHDDRNSPSLSVKAENGKLLLHCFAGCRPVDVISATGLDWSDLFTEEG